MRVQQQPAVVLLNRPYSESSWVVEIFSRDYGRLALMAKGARRIKSKLKGVLLPFQPLLLSWSGKGEIPTVTAAEIDIEEYDINDYELRGDNAVCGFYCNELIVNLLHRNDPHKQLFDQYIQTLKSLGSGSANELHTVLRQFEGSLIKEIGYGVNFELQANSKAEIVDEHFYQFHQGEGFKACSEHQPNAVKGSIIKSLSNQNADLPGRYSQQHAQAKLLMRDILNQTLGYKNIISRELFVPKNRVNENSKL